jgi:hypothetical protein
MDQKEDFTDIRWRLQQCAYRLLAKSDTHGPIFEELSRRVIDICREDLFHQQQFEASQRKIR